MQRLRLLRRRGLSRYPITVAIALSLSPHVLISYKTEQKSAFQLPTLQLIRIHKNMGPKRVLITYGVDVDAVAGWLGSYGGEDSSNDISRGASCPLLVVAFNKLGDRLLGGYSWNTATAEAVRQV